jgi:APA family basic amino acid/polyamine antiporter
MKTELPRILGPAGATLFVVTFAIGTAIFLVPGVVAANAGSVGMSIALWVAGGLLTLCGSLCYSELAVRIPRSGGEYRYMFAGWGPRLAFIFAWTTLFTMPVGIAAVARGFADYFAAIWPLEEAARRAAAAIAIAFFASISIASTRAATRVAGFAAIAKLLALLAVALAGILAAAGPEPSAAEAAAAAAAGGSIPQLATGLVAIIWAFDGCMSVAYIAGEVRDPGRTVPRALLTGLAIITVVYVLMNATYFHALGFAGVAGSDAVAAATLGSVLGPAAANVVAAMVMVSAMGTLAAQCVGNPRFFIGPAEDGLFPSKLASISPRTLTPVNAIAMTAGIAICLVALGGYAFLIRLYVLGFYPLVVVALFAAVRLRLREGRPREFSMPLYPLPLVVYGTGVVGICVASALADPVGAAFGLAVPLSGAVVYALKRR